ncbi:phosphoinositide phosphatase [Niveomyces insectorum RCEF 264]|uniref:Phosphoinositide phosphatase n=1 Tax=Niveomyces insectorum RCEF 264 TaxID=1081102 RepID=A0A167VRC8_9HYPO|nr:phosphoinositide phosphatase [Niveomyces insectorum RCEF 264]
MAFPFRDINVQVASDCYVFKSPSSPDAPALVIGRPTGEVHLDDAALLSSGRVTRVFSIKGILGVIQLRLDKYVIIITKDEHVGRLKGHMIHRIVEVDFLPVHERQIRDPDEDRFLALLRSFFKAGPMYFSYTLDLSNSFQRQAAQQDLAGAAETPLWMRADDRFFWNRFVQSDLIAFRRHGGRGSAGAQPGIDPYILPVIFGMLEIHPTAFRGRPLTLVLITRRSRFRGGTRFFSRGIDDEGHVANYNETEQIVVLNDTGRSSLGGYSGSGDMQSGRQLIGADGASAGQGQETQILSYVQTRGSVPVFWSEINNLKYTPRLEVRGDARGIEAALPAARAHLAEQIRIYGDNYLVNLVNQKGRERRIKEAYERMVENVVSMPPKETVQGDRITSEKFHTIEGSASAGSKSGGVNSPNPFDRVHYIYFDFHSETKGMRLDRARLLLDQMHDALLAQQYFRAADMPAGGAGAFTAGGGRLEARNLQTSVVRTNCMDCLDRTNVVQSMLARWTLERMFADLGLMVRGGTLVEQDPAFELLFRNLWADNADRVAASYAGTGAMKTDMTRLGRRTKSGALRDGQIAVTRYCRNNFLDGPRQDAFDLFLGAYAPGEAAVAATQLLFADRRPVLIQAVPYVLAFSVFFLLVGLLTRRLPDAAVLPLRLFLLFWTAVAGYCAHFILRSGELYVNWPKLIPRPGSTDDYHEAMNKARKDRLLGPFVARHERGLSMARYLSAEEGKKRIE